MADLVQQPVVAGKSTAGFLGVALVPGTAVYFARQGEVEVAVLASARVEGRKAFRTGRTLSVEYRLFPRTARDREVAPLVERLSADILSREAETAASLPPADPAGQPGPAGIPGLEPISLADSGDVATYRLSLRESGLPAVLRVASREHFEWKLFDWSGQIEEPDRLSPRDALRIQRFFLGVVACHMLGLPKPLEKREEASKGSVSARFLYFELGKPPVNVPDAAPLNPGDPVVLSLDIPSRCDNRCVFCAPADALGIDLPAPSAVLDQLKDLLARLEPALAEAGRVDVNLVGMDVFNFPHIEPLVALVRSFARVTRITAVSPGTRLSDAALAASLKAAGLDSVTLTLLGPDPASHDSVAGRTGAFANLSAIVRSLERAGIALEFNCVVVRQNAHLVPAILEQAERFGSRVRLYFYVTEPFVPDEQARACYARLTDVAQLLDRFRSTVEPRLLSVHYMPLCVLPDWLVGLAGHASQKYPDAPEAAPDPCGRCPRYLAGCSSVSAHYLRIFGAQELTPLPAG